uniref:Uncharacterized protein n=1 Tax=Meloidogyne incognita TaxID=6306 RepID=A0A914MJL1_MELIC
MKILFHRKVFKIFVLQFFLILVIVNLVKASSGGGIDEIEEVNEDIQEEGELTEELTTDYLREMKGKMKVFGKGGGLKKLEYKSKAKNKYMGEGSTADPFMEGLKKNIPKLESILENNHLNDILQTIKKIRKVNSKISEFLTSSIKFEIFFEIFKDNLKNVNKHQVIK